MAGWPAARWTRDDPRCTSTAKSSRRRRCPALGGECASKAWSPRVARRSEPPDDHQGRSKLHPHHRQSARVQRPSWTPSTDCSQPNRPARSTTCLSDLPATSTGEEFRHGDFLVRNLLGADENRGILAVGALPRAGQTIQFHRRDAESATADLTGCPHANLGEPEGGKPCTEGSFACALVGDADCLVGPITMRA